MSTISADSSRLRPSTVLRLSCAVWESRTSGCTTASASCFSVRQRRWGRSSTSCPISMSSHPGSTLNDAIERASTSAAISSTPSRCRTSIPRQVPRRRVCSTRGWTRLRCSRSTCRAATRKNAASVRFCSLPGRRITTSSAAHSSRPAVPTSSATARTPHQAHQNAAAAGEVRCADGFTAREGTRSRVRAPRRESHSAGEGEKGKEAAKPKDALKRENCIRKQNSPPKEKAVFLSAGSCFVRQDMYFYIASIFFPCFSNKAYSPVYHCFSTSFLRLPIVRGSPPTPKEQSTSHRKAAFFQ